MANLTSHQTLFQHFQQRPLPQASEGQGACSVVEEGTRRHLCLEEETNSNSSSKTLHSVLAEEQQQEAPTPSGRQQTSEDLHLARLWWLRTGRGTPSFSRPPARTP